MSTESSGKPDAGNLHVRVGAEGAIPRPTPRRPDGALLLPGGAADGRDVHFMAQMTGRGRWRESMPLPDRDVPNGNGRGPRPIGGAVLADGGREQTG